MRWNNIIRLLIIIIIIIGGVIIIIIYKWPIPPLPGPDPGPYLGMLKYLGIAQFLAGLSLLFSLPKLSKEIEQDLKIGNK